MQSQLVAMLIFTSCNQVTIRGGRLDDEPPRVPRVNTIHFMDRGVVRELTLEIPAKTAPAGEEADELPAPPVMHINLRTAGLERDNFDRWLFDHEVTERARQKHLEAILDTKIEHSAVVEKLTDPQRAKLRLAGRGDIKRFFDEIQKKRDEFEIERKTFNTGLQAFRRLDELSTSYRDGPFGGGSLFAKTLWKINNDRRAGH